MPLPLACSALGTQSATQACALTGNRTGNPVVHRPDQSTEPHQPGHNASSLCAVKIVLKITMSDKNWIFLDMQCDKGKIN